MTAANADNGREAPRSLRICVTAVVLEVRSMIVVNVAIEQEAQKFQLFCAMVVDLGARRTTAVNVGVGVLDHS